MARSDSLCPVSAVNCFSSPGAPASRLAICSGKHTARHWPMRSRLVWCLQRPPLALRMGERNVLDEWPWLHSQSVLPLEKVLELFSAHRLCRHASNEGYASSQ